MYSVYTQEKIDPLFWLEMMKATKYTSGTHQELIDYLNARKDQLKIESDDIEIKELLYNVFERYMEIK